MNIDLREIAIKILIPIGMMGGFAFIAYFIKNRELKRARSGQEMKVNLKNGPTAPVANSNIKKINGLQWFWFLGFLVSSAIAEVLLKNTNYPNSIYFVLPFVVFFGFKIIQQLIQHTKKTDNSYAGNPTTGTKFKMQIECSRTYQETLEKWAQEKDFIKHESCTPNTIVFVKKGGFWLPRYISVTDENGKLEIKAWVQLNNQAMPIKPRQVMPIPHGKLRKELNTLLSLLGQSEI